MKTYVEDLNISLFRGKTYVSKKADMMIYGLNIDLNYGAGIHVCITRPMDSRRSV